ALTSTSLDFGLVYDLPNTAINLKNHSDFLKEYNTKILEYASFLDQEVQHQLFLKDVIVFDYEVSNTSVTNSISRVVTQFEALDEIIDNIYKLNSMSDLRSDEAFRIFYSIRYNILYDFLNKCD